jgi:Domain of unknown function (DUF4129)
MSTKRGRQAAARATPPVVIRVAAEAVLLGVTAIGLRARGALSPAPSTALASAGGHAGAAVLAALEGAGLVGCAALVVLLFRRLRRRRPADEDFEHVQWRPPLPWWVKALALAASLAMLAAPIAALVAVAGRRPAAVRPGPAAPLGTPRPGPGHVVPPGPATVWPTVAGVILAIAALVALAVIARRGRLDHETVPQSAHVREPGDLGALAASVMAGSHALFAADSPRQAIIDCYAAMERGLAEAGTPPAAADTPGELLARAAARGVVRGSAASELTGLFRRARYGLGNVTETDRAAAATALTRLRADLGGAGA